ncbi:MAG TPA: hypothetical protein VFQ77_06695, partial [Pseudonocardiaceae bacterium]|nr:hypothetical protein [Pseudonocardiaceae bacterium]
AMSRDMTPPRRRGAATHVRVTTADNTGQHGRGSKRGGHPLVAHPWAHGKHPAPKVLVRPAL